MALCFFCGNKDALASVPLSLIAGSESAIEEAKREQWDRWNTDEAFRQKLIQEAQNRRPLGWNETEYTVYTRVLRVPRCEQCKEYHHSLEMLSIKLFVLSAVPLALVLLGVGAIFRFGGIPIWAGVLLTLFGAAVLGGGIAFAIYYRHATQKWRSGDSPKPEWAWKSFPAYQELRNKGWRVQ
jgi:hypothetical protein